MDNMERNEEEYLFNLHKVRLAVQSIGVRPLENPYRPALQAMLQSVLVGVTALNDPGRNDLGAPDFVLIKGNYPIGYIETKPFETNLADTIQGEQIKRYFGYANLILTNYIEFHFFKHGKAYCEPITVADQKTLSPLLGAFELFKTTIQAFLDDAIEPVRRASRLAEIMGENAKRLSGNLRHYLLKGDLKKNTPIFDMYESFRHQLIHDLNLEQFADMYTQTLVYGLFVARYYDTTPENFNRSEALDLIPDTNPLLRRFFAHVAGQDFDSRLAPIVDELCSVLRATDVPSLMNKIYQQDLWGMEQVAPDPVIHFYEDFLEAYDSEKRRKFGAYYTPPPVVRFIIRSVDKQLKTNFNLPAGLADTTKINIVRKVQGRRSIEALHKVQILDPALGTGTFLNETIRYIRRSFVGQEGLFSSYAKDDLIPRLYGFELMMAPYTIAHLKLAMTLRESGAVEFNRLGVYITNSLEKAKTNDGTLFASLGLTKSLTEEGQAAARIKNDTPIMVVIGNPPYSGESSNKDYNDHDVYKIEPGTSDRLQERNSKWINDDYVKFIRLAESLVEKTGEGIVGMITAHGYLENPTFRGMRYHLMQTFSEIYVLDLHGNSNRGETDRDGGSDENIFDIKQGVAIFIGVRREGKQVDKLATVYRSDCYGKREGKFRFLEKFDFSGRDWRQISTFPPYYEWAAHNGKIRRGYMTWPSLKSIFDINVLGYQTHRDSFAVSEYRNELSQRLDEFSNPNIATNDIVNKYHLKTKKWNIESARRNLDGEHLEDYVSPTTYRPFDNRYAILYKGISDRPRKEILQHVVNRDNLTLLCSRQQATVGFHHVFVTKLPANDCVMSTKSREANQVFPLYVFAKDGSRISNIKKDYMSELMCAINANPNPEEVFDYIYAILHSPSYREKFGEFLKIDFPRIPLPKDKTQFDSFAKLGRELCELHLFESSVLQNFITTYPVVGTDTVNEIRWDSDKVFINGVQYFGGIMKGIWEFYIGGYQPAQKWLKDRVGRKLIANEIERYQRIIVALTETQKLMATIDGICKF